MMLSPTIVLASDSFHCRKIQHKNSRVTPFIVKMSLFWMEIFLQYISSNVLKFVCLLDYL